MRNGCLLPSPPRPGSHPVRSALRHRAPAGRGMGPVDAAVEELRGMANGRGDLLAEQAGLLIDAASVRPVTAEYRAALRLLMAAGADEDQLAGWVELGRQRGSAPQPSILTGRGSTRVSGPYWTPPGECWTPPTGTRLAANQRHRRGAWHYRLRVDGCPT
jgi:hypothetical protein